MQLFNSIRDFAVSNLMKVLNNGVFANSIRDFAVSNLMKVLNNGVFANSMRKNRKFNSLATISITETVEDYFHAETIVQSHPNAYNHIG